MLVGTCFAGKTQPRRCVYEGMRAYHKCYPTVTSRTEHSDLEIHTCVLSLRPIFLDGSKSHVTVSLFPISVRGGGTLRSAYSVSGSRSTSVATPMMTTSFQRLIFFISLFLSYLMFGLIMIDDPSSSTSSTITRLVENISTALYTHIGCCRTLRLYLMLTAVLDVFMEYNLSSSTLHPYSCHSPLSHLHIVQTTQTGCRSTFSMNLSLVAPQLTFLRIEHAKFSTFPGWNLHSIAHFPLLSQPLSPPPKIRLAKVSFRQNIHPWWDALCLAAPGATLVPHYFPHIIPSPMCTCI